MIDVSSFKVGDFVSSNQNSGTDYVVIEVDPKDGHPVEVEVVDTNGKGTSVRYREDEAWRTPGSFRNCFSLSTRVKPSTKPSTTLSAGTRAALASGQIKVNTLDEGKLCTGNPCECGAFKTMRIEVGMAGHSYWCPAAPKGRK